MQKSGRAEVDALSGAVISSVVRWHYVHDAVVDREVGPIEVTFEDGRVLRFDCAANGQTLRTETKPVDDLFAEPLSVNNRDYVGQFGKWTRFEVSVDAPYNALVGETIRRFERVSDQFGGDGRVVVSSGGSLEVVCQADDIQVRSIALAE